MADVPQVNYGDDAEYQKKLREMLMQRMQEQERGLEAESVLGKESAASESKLGRQLGLMNVINKSAAQFGSIGGRVADASPVDDYTKSLIGVQQQNVQDLRTSRQDRDKLNQYLMGKMLDQEGKISEGRAAAAKSAQDQARYNQEIALKKQGLQLEAKKAEQTKEKPPTDTQLLTAGFAKRANEASRIADNLEQGGYDPASYLRAARSAPGVRALAMNAQDRQYQQAQKEFIAAILRKESGGAITPDEFTEYGAIYFPAPGDDAQTIAQKRESRARVIASLGSAAGESSMARMSVPEANLPPMQQSGGVGISETATASQKQPLPPNKMRVSNGKETVIIDRTDMAEALEDGYKEVK